MGWKDGVMSVKAVGLFSGGLDSQLAARVLQLQGVEVELLHCITDPERFEGARVEEGASRLGAPLRALDVSEEFFEVVRSPRFGYGSGMNPCLDCRILMLRKAKALMEEAGARFVFTGEVLGQRPMSQHRGALRLVERESGLDGLLLRPLSAKLLPPTTPELEGWVDREGLYDFSGRSRKPQMALAKELGISEYPSPAGGCWLTDRTFSARLRDLFGHGGCFTREQAVLLRVGRHFRLSEGVKTIVGRNRDENALLLEHREGRWVVQVMDYPGPVVLVEGEPSEEDLLRAASVAVRYSDGRDREDVRVRWERDGEEGGAEGVCPADEEELSRWRL